MLLGLAVMCFYTIYQVEVTMGKESGTVQIRNNFMKEYGIDLETLHELALKNTQEKYPFSCKSMTEMMRDIMKRTLVEEEGLDEATAEIMANLCELEMQIGQTMEELKKLLGL